MSKYDAIPKSGNRSPEEQQAISEKSTTAADNLASSDYSTRYDAYRVATEGLSDEERYSVYVDIFQNKAAYDKAMERRESDDEEVEQEALRKIEERIAGSAYTKLMRSIADQLAELRNKSVLEEGDQQRIADLEGSLTERMKRYNETGSPDQDVARAIYDATDGANESKVADMLAATISYALQEVAEKKAKVRSSNQPMLPLSPEASATLIPAPKGSDKAPALEKVSLPSPPDPFRRPPLSQKTSYLPPLPEKVQSPISYETPESPKLLEQYKVAGGRVASEAPSTTPKRKAPVKVGKPDPEKWRVRPREKAAGGNAGSTAGRHSLPSSGHARARTHESFPTPPTPPVAFESPTSPDRAEKRRTIMKGIKNALKVVVRGPFFR